MSQIQGWDVQHLEDAAQRWDSTAQLWEDCFESVHRGSLNPGGSVWEGDAAEAVQERTFADLVKVRGLADVLREASSVARWGASDLLYAQQAVLAAVEAAQAAGFTVGEDLSVSDPTPLASLLRGGRQAQAEELAADIAWRAELLSALDTDVATKITTITAPLHEVSFNEAPVDNPTNDIHALDHKQSTGNGDGRPSLDEILDNYQIGEDPGGTHEFDFPAWVDEIFGKEVKTQELTATEIRMLLTNPTKIKDVFDIKEQSTAEALKRFRPPDGVREIDNHTDAFRHAYANALMTQKFGEEWTRDFTTAHEGREGNWAASEAMDLYNNQVGRRIAVENPNASSDELAVIVQQAVENGETVVIRPDGEGLEWSDRILSAKTGDSSESGKRPGVPHPGPSYGS